MSKLVINNKIVARSSDLVWLKKLGVSFKRLCSNKEVRIVKEDMTSHIFFGA